MFFAATIIITNSQLFNILRKMFRSASKQLTSFGFIYVCLC